MQCKILLIEDEKKLVRILKLVLEDNGYQVKTAYDGQQGIDTWTEFKPDLVVTDLKMHPVGGMEVLRFAQLNFPEIPLIILTAFGSIETAVSAMKSGAFDFLAKPVDHNNLLEVIQHALLSVKAGSSKKTGNFENLIGNSDKMKQIKKDILLFATTSSSVLINGESGTGKEIAARAVHKASKLKSGPFVKVNCAAIPKELIESELFGHKKGAFTGALQDRKGAFVKADKGILFLDEIGDLPLELQPKLLNAVEEKTITPVGSNDPISVTVKILSATNLNLKSMIEESKFRADLYYRLNTVSLNMPSLRDKKEDIKELAMFFIEKYSKEFEKPIPNIDEKAMQTLENYHWPGNVRELKNVIERLMLMCNKDLISIDDMPQTIVKHKNDTNNDDMENISLDMAAQEQSLLHQALEQCSWNQSEAAKKLGITRSALRYRLQKYGIKK